MLFMTVYSFLNTKLIIAAIDLNVLLYVFFTITASQVEYLTSKYHIYLLNTGRINVCGLNPRNVEYVADAIKDAVLTYPETV